MSRINYKKVTLGLLYCLTIGMVLTLFINVYVICSTKKQIVNIDNYDKLNNFNAILILGCKVNENSPSLMLKNRLDKGIEVYNKYHKKIIISGSKKDDYDEISVMKKYLLDNGVNYSDIFLDYDGHSTYDSLYRIKEIFGADNIIIVTQEYHMYRALYIANRLNIEAYGISANDIPQNLVMLKNVIREVFSRDKNFFKMIFKPKSKYISEIIPIN